MLSIKDAVQDLVNKRRNDGVMNYLVPACTTVKSSAPIVDILRLFALNPTDNYTVLVHEDADSRKLRGIISRSDLRRTGLTADEIASTPVIAIRNASTLDDALRLMNGDNSLGLRLDCLPVVNDSGSFVGVVSMDGINKKIRESL